MENIEILPGVELTDATKKVILKYCEKTGEAPRQVLLKALKSFFEKEGSLPSPSKTGKIEYETMTVRVPKKIMDFLRSMQQAWNQTPVEYFEEVAVDSVRASLEAASGEEFIAWFDLAPIFYQVLGDERFKKTDC